MEQRASKINVLQLDTEKTWRGGENQMRLLCEGLADSRYMCHLALDPRGEAYQRLKNSYPVLPVKMSGGFDLLAAWKIAQYCSSNDIRIIDAQTSNAHSLALLVKTIMSKLKVVVHRRVDYIPKQNWITKKKYYSKSVDYYVAISRMIGIILSEYGIEKDKLGVVPSAVDPAVYLEIDREAARRALCIELNIDANSILLGNASAMTSQKGYDVLLRALHILSKSGKKFHCVIAGDGPLRGSLEAMRTEFGLESSLTFLGWIKKVPEFLSALDILVMPSNYEGLGTLILDATYAGCVIIASNAGGIPEMIEHRKGGLISPVGDHQLLAKHIVEAIESPELCRQYIQYAQSHIRAHFSLAAMVRGNERIYDTVLRQSVSG